MTELTACDRCLARTALLARLAGHIDQLRGRAAELLELDEEALITAVGGREADAIRAEHAARASLVARTRETAASAGLDMVCRCAEGYPPALRDLVAAPAVLHIVGAAEILRTPTTGVVAIVGSRRASPYGIAVAGVLARGLSAAGLVVVSGLAAGIDAAAHHGALDGGGRTVAILAASPDRAYPRSARRLHDRIRETGAVLSEFPPGAENRRWMFPARNRLIAALAQLTIVVEGRARSGALLTAGWARELGRIVAAVPGQVSSPLAAGPLGLLRDGATLVRGPEDVLEAIYGAAARERVPQPAALSTVNQALLDALAAGFSTGVAIARSGLEPGEGLAALASLELDGRVVRGPGGRYLANP